MSGFILLILPGLIPQPHLVVPPLHSDWVEWDGFIPTVTCLEIDASQSTRLGNNQIGPWSVSLMVTASDTINIQSYTHANNSTCRDDQNRTSEVLNTTHHLTCLQIEPFS